MEVFKKDIIQSENPEDDEEQMLGKRLINLPDEKKQKLQELKKKINAARKDNLKAVYEEENKNTNPNYIKKVKEEKRQEYKKEVSEDQKFKGIKDQNHMNKPAFQRDDTKQKGKLKNEVFGWDVFNEDA